MSDPIIAISEIDHSIFFIGKLNILMASYNKTTSMVFIGNSFQRDVLPYVLEYLYNESLPISLVVNN